MTDQELKIWNKDKKEFVRLSNLAEKSGIDLVNDAIGSGEINAMDSARESGFKGSLVEDWAGYYTTALGSICESCAFQENEDVQEFFKKAGYLY
jgi:hypothetical protein